LDRKLLYEINNGVELEEKGRLRKRRDTETLEHRDDCVDVRLFNNEAILNFDDLSLR